MPVAHIQVLRGHRREVLRSLIARVSDSMSRILGAPADRLEVWITEIDPELWGVRGAPALDALEAEPLGAVEMPFIQMILLKGRPIEQHHALIAEITGLVSETLGTDKKRIRMAIIECAPESWGIGGVPASVLRAAEIKARADLKVAG